MGTYQSEKKTETRINIGLRPDQGVKVRTSDAYHLIEATRHGQAAYLRRNDLFGAVRKSAISEPVIGHTEKLLHRIGSGLGIRPTRNRRWVVWFASAVPIRGCDRVCVLTVLLVRQRWHVDLVVASVGQSPQTTLPALRAPATFQVTST